MPYKPTDNDIYKMKLMLKLLKSKGYNVKPHTQHAHWVIIDNNIIVTSFNKIKFGNVWSQESFKNIDGLIAQLECGVPITNQTYAIDMNDYHNELLSGSKPYSVQRSDGSTFIQNGNR